jgi:hypothetical protein
VAPGSDSTPGRVGATSFLERAERARHDEDGEEEDELDEGERDEHRDLQLANGLGLPGHTLQSRVADQAEADADAERRDSDAESESLSGHFLVYLLGFPSCGVLRSLEILVGGRRLVPVVAVIVVGVTVVVMRH